MPRLAYILSASHSGSTLLAMLLNSHPEVCSVGELKATNLGDTDGYRCSCGELIQKCGFWDRVSHAMAHRGFEFDVTHAGTHYQNGPTAYTRRLLRPLHRGRALEAARDAALWLSPVWRAYLPAVQRRNAALVESVTEITGARVLVDSSKLAMRLKYLLRNQELDVKVVRLIRDGRAVALTYMDPARFADARDPSLRDGGSGGDRRYERLSMSEAAWQWRRSNEEAENVLAGLDRSRWTEVRYEDICADPQGTLRRVVSFLDLDPSEWVQDFRTVEHHIVGNGMRLDATSEIQLDDRWQSALTFEHLAVFNRTAGRLNRRYGYDV